MLPQVGVKYYRCAEMIRLFELIPQEHTVLPYELRYFWFHFFIAPRRRLYRGLRGSPLLLRCEGDGRCRL